MGLSMIDLFCDSFERVPQRIVLDIDDTSDAVHGGQQPALFNAHYGYEPQHWPNQYLGGKSQIARLAVAERDRTLDLMEEAAPPKPNYRDLSE